MSPSLLAFPALLAFKTAPVFQYWDIGVIITVAVLLMAVFTAWIIRLHIKPSYAALVWIPFLIIVFNGYSHVISEEKASSEIWVNNLETTARVLAAATESLGHAQLTDLTDDNQKKIYQHLLDLQTKWCSDIPFIAYIYTLRRIPGTVNKCCWVVSCPADVNKDGKIDGPNEEGENFGSPYDEWFDIYQKGFDGEMALDENVHSRQYGDFVTVVVPLHDLRISGGHPYTEAILGIDVFKSDWNIISERLHAVLVQTFIIHLLLYAAIVITVSIVVVNMQKLKKANAGTLAAQMRAEHLTRAKSNFMSVMNKEITTPLEAVVGFTNVLTQRVAQNCSREMKEEAEGLFEIINKNSQDLTLAVNNVIDYAKIEANMLQVEMVPISLKSVIDDVCRVVKPDISAKNLGFGVNFLNDIPSLILSDPVRLRQILTSIINHAVDLTERGAVQIHCSTKPPTTDFEAAVSSPVSTSDKTPSIIAMDNKHLFASLTMLQIDIIAGGTPLSQIQSKSKVGNNAVAVMPDNPMPLYDEGFGLSFGKRIASLLDGVVLVSPSGHSGMMFSLLLNVFIPKDKQSAVRSAMEFQSYPPQGSQLEPGLAIRDPARLEGTESEKEGLPLKRTRVLVVEDVVTNQMVVSAQLRDAGAIVDISENGDAAVKKINENIDNGIFYDVVLMDTQMPVMDGFQATAVLRGQEYRVPIILMTAHALMGDREKCFETGCNDYISKPVNKDELLNMIMKHWSRSS